MSEIYVIDDLHPEDNAMLQALYSRSPKGVQEHVEKVRNADSGHFMEKFYVGYGHMSIADCGSTTIFVEHVSMFVAKAIQDWPLYSGQEASTRYLDFSKQPIVNPAGTEEAAKIQKRWIEFYEKSLPSVQAHLKIKYPIKSDEKESVYEKAIAARSFDIMRGFLPAGSTTFLSWHTNLRQAHEKLALLEHHPLQEVREVAANIREALNEKYKNSFAHPKFPKQQEYWKKYVGEETYFCPDDFPDFEYSNTLELDKLKEHEELMAIRPEKTNLPHFLSMYGQCTFKFKLDFGSFRDLQRHRNGVCRMPLLSTKYGFYPWYLNELPEDVRKESEQLIGEQEKAVMALPVDDTVRQYYLPMGYTITASVTYALPASVYVAELRSNKTVHPTLRLRAQQMGRALRESVPGLTMYIDENPDDWDIRRGTQDIINKEDESIQHNRMPGPEHGHRSGGAASMVSPRGSGTFSQDDNSGQPAGIAERGDNGQENLGISS